MVILEVEQLLIFQKFSNKIGTGDREKCFDREHNVKNVCRQI